MSLNGLLVWEWYACLTHVHVYDPHVLFHVYMCLGGTWYIWRCRSLWRLDRCLLEWQFRCRKQKQHCLIHFQESCFIFFLHIVMATFIGRNHGRTFTVRKANKSANGLGHFLRRLPCSKQTFETIFFLFLKVIFFSFECVYFYRGFKTAIFNSDQKMALRALYIIIW